VKRFLLALVVFAVILAVLRRLAGTLGGRAAGGPRKGARARGSRGESTELVRDRVCNTFLPRRAALTMTVAGEVHHFCSEDCRARFAAGLPAAGAPVTR
jgi:YHS domain-containing protein